MPLYRPSYFEVHVADVIFEALNIGQDNVALAVAEQAHRDTADRTFDRHARVHQRQGAAADACHRRAAVRREDFADHTERIGELVFGRDHGPQRRFRQRTVPDLTPSGAAQRGCFAGRKRRHIVMVHVPLGIVGR